MLAHADACVCFPIVTYFVSTCPCPYALTGKFVQFFNDIILIFNVRTILDIGLKSEVPDVPFFQNPRVD